MLKKDNWILGIALGILVPVIIYILMMAGMEYWAELNPRLNPNLLKKSTFQLTGIFFNMFTFRYYMVNLKYDKTGRGILMATFIYAGIFVYMYMF